MHIGYPDWRWPHDERTLFLLGRLRAATSARVRNESILLRSDAHASIAENLMPISPRLASYLNERIARYEVCEHEHTETSAQTARCAHVSPRQLAKSVILEDESGCVMAVVPADQRVHIGELARLLGRHDLRLSDEARVKMLFHDCSPGAVPALGMAWGMETILEQALESAAEIYIEAGDHEQLIKLSREDFNALMRGARRAHFTQAWQH
jgi:Ala-tRNA(Pro) deacylase